MYQEGLVVRTKLAPPRPQRNTLHRRRLTERLLDGKACRLTILQAGTGYGKSTTLAALEASGYPLVWYHLDSDDADPLTFLLHLVHGFGDATGVLSGAPLAMLERWGSEGGLVDGLRSSWMAVVDALVNELAQGLSEPLFLVVDDVHHLNQATQTIQILDRFIARAPATVHPFLATRHPVSLPGLVNWRVKGEVLEVGQDELAFNEREISELFRDQYGLDLSPDQVKTLAARSEGWPIALQLVWQRLQRGKGASVNQALEEISGAAGDLFAYLANEVLAQQPADIQEFLRSTSVLRTMTVAACNCLRSRGDSDQILRYLLDNDLFVVNLGDGHLRYHFLFRDFLGHQGSAQGAAHGAGADRRPDHLKAAICYRHLGDDEEALYHLLAGESFENAAELIGKLGPGMIRAGRLGSLSSWIEALPPEILEKYSSLLAYLGDIARLHSRFDDALAWYKQAEERSRARSDLRGIGQALRGQARVYLDTLDPDRAERLLQEALHLSDGQEDRESRARLLELLAENLLNRGRVDEAEGYQAQARHLRQEGPAKAELSVRLLLRTGRLDQARRLLEERAESERREPVLRPRAHRETLLLLSLILAFQGDRRAAFESAVEGTERGRVLESHFITAVGLMRQGHAWLLHKDAEGYQQAADSFQEAIRLSERLDVPRIRVEANWGLCMVYGFRGDLSLARRAAEQGIEMAQAFGDVWVEACIRLSMGAGYALAERHRDAAPWLARAAMAYTECGDTHGQAVCRLWQSLVWQAIGDEARLARDVTDLMELLRDHNYDFLFLAKTLMGPPDPRSLVPILLFAQGLEGVAPVADVLMKRLGLEGLRHHPGYQLSVRTFGAFQAWRGQEEIRDGGAQAAGGWRRKKARQLFLLLLTFRRTLLDRDQIINLLWPSLGPDEGQRDFKIAMSSLYSTLEPNRDRNEPSAYVRRDGTRYGLRPEADLWVDAEQFDRLVNEGNALLEGELEGAVDRFSSALALYKGEYLQEYPYEEWCSEERERLLALYLRTAERLSHILVEMRDYDEAVDICQLILARDNCWENAYRLLMVAYREQGNRAQAIRTYERCVDNLRNELDVEPTAVTKSLYQAIVSESETTG